MIQSCQFQNVSGTQVDIQSIVFKSGTTLTDAGCDIWWWDLNRVVDDVVTPGFLYSTWSECYSDPDSPDADEDGYVYEYCWVDNNTEEDEEFLKKTVKTFAPGEGFYAQSSRKNPKLFFPNPFKK